ncbi:MAG: ankyrin repeat domain-containing protein, partial [Gemmatimonadaceae bacterium]
MVTVSRGLPDRPHLDVPEREARELLGEWRTGDRDALARLRHRHPQFEAADDSAIAAGPFRLSDAQLVIAREYGFAQWTELKQRIETNAFAHALLVAIRDDDRDAAVQIVRAEPRLLHLPLWSGNWGPPMSHAANLGRLEIIEAMAALGARDFQHAFDRALLQGRIECARWLHAHGATLAPGIIMGSCETLNASGFDFLADLGAPLTNERGDRLAPLALVLGTYGRNPAGKYAILDSLVRHGHDLPDTPIMAFHRGSVAGLEAHLRRDPSLLARRFTLREIYPPELGCAEGGGMHWTPIDGTTLLHLAIDFMEREVFDWLVARGAHVDARALVDAEGFGGHTPLFH